ncbi:hypothetical protein IMG5_084960 [Ichthyophthirius multifiliis]|uniref:Exportin-1/Importin-beta-like domain-containing protein n=1 Tax=Ichthyophthirius multifiliis TaxID=5932 RepID=G0QQW6_ICHMU|nr:hypothetical protein IMG5_084960 [Ichthyophthirius multifiliis]EGR32396.1 hypothetical protein IMG5_084960 [Ichthyophthirius multifiliis]|eukprot:XP_004035882.1 hypothetical protein IMG5_084960 [Ichthyophthirius multifiliis]
MQESITKEIFIEKYLILQNSQNKYNREQANQYIINFQKSQQSWQISRELLITEDPQIQFLGAQIIYLKLKQQFLQLTPENQNELKLFLFQCLEKNLQTPTLRQLCSAISILGIIGISQSTWHDFIENLIFYMQKGEKELILGLEIIKSLPENLQDMILGQSQVNQIKEFLLSKKTYIFQIWDSLLILNNSNIIEKTLQCINSWNFVNFYILDQLSILEKILNQQNYKEIVCEILQKTLKNSPNIHILEENTLHETKKHLPENEVLSIEKFLFFVITKVLFHVKSFFKFLRFSRFYQLIVMRKFIKNQHKFSFFSFLQKASQYPLHHFLFFNNILKTQKLINNRMWKISVQKSTQKVQKFSFRKQSVNPMSQTLKKTPQIKKKSLIQKPTKKKTTKKKIYKKKTMKISSLMNIEKIHKKYFIIYFKLQGILDKKKAFFTYIITSSKISIKIYKPQKPQYMPVYNLQNLSLYKNQTLMHNKCFFTQLKKCQFLP